MNSRSPADRRAVRRIAAFAAAVVLLAPSVALAAVPPYYDIATNSDQPASTAERGQTYLLYNLNPLRNETVTIDDKITTPVSYTHLRAHETGRISYAVFCLKKKKNK